MCRHPPPSSRPRPGIEARAYGEVTVLIANTTRIIGAAARSTDQLIATGYLTETAVNARGGGLLERTKVHYEPGFLLEAQRLAAEEFGLTEADVFQMPASPPVDDLLGANILVLLGSDRAA